MSLNQVYHYDGVTKTAITASVIKLSATQGVFPDFGGMTVELSYPVLDANGSEVTLEKGDLIWCNVRYASTMMFTPGLGIINDIKRSRDFITVKVESMLEPLMRMRYTIDNGVSGFVKDRIWDIVTKYTPPHGVTAISQFLAYRRQTGSETWNLDTTMSKVVHGLEVDVKAYLQYLIEQPANLWLEKPTGTIYPVYDYYDHWALPTLKVGYTGYGNHRQADLVLSIDNGILSEIVWEEPTESILNDVTITVRGGGTEQFTDDASIAAYGKRQTALSRGFFTEDAIGGYDATQSIKSIVKSMCVPHKRCRLTCEATAIFNTWQTIGGMYRVIDEQTGQDEYMALRSFTYKYPEEVCECEFDNAPLDMSKYGLRMENRVTSLESNMVTAHSGFYDLQGGVSPNQYYHLSQAAYNNLYQQDQAVKTTSTPRFAAINIGDDCKLSDAGTNLLYTPNSLQLAGGVFAGNNCSISGMLTLNGRFGAEVTTLQLIRGANNYGWNYRLEFRPYTGDGALSDSKPAWYFQAGYSSHELNIQHYNGSTQTTVMQFLVDKNVNIVNGLSVGSLKIPGTNNATVTNESGTGAIRVTSSANGYVSIGPQNTGACHIYTDRACFAFNKTIFTTSGDLGSSTYKWGSLHMNGSLYNAGNLFMDSSRNLTLGAGNITTTGILTASGVYLGAGGPSLQGEGSNTIRLGTDNRLTQGGFQFLGPNREFYGTSFSIPVQASSNYRNFHDAEKFFSWGTTYARQKTITLTNGIGPGTFLVRYEIRGATSVSRVYGKIYINGTDSGGYKTQTGTTWAEGTATIIGPLEPGSTVELWCYQNGGDGNGGYCRNFRIGYDVGTDITMPSTNS